MKLTQRWRLLLLPLVIGSLLQLTYVAVLHDNKVEMHVRGLSSDLRGALKSTSQLEKHLLEEYKWRTRVGMNADSKSSELLDLPMQINQTLSESRDKSISNFNESFVDKFLNKFGSLMGSPGSSDFPYIIHDGKLFCRPEHFNYTRRKENRSEISHFGSDTFVEGDEDVNTFKYYNRIQPFEQMIALALQIGSRLQHFHPLLHHIVGEGSKIPLIFNGGDFCHCNGKKWPLFTFAKAASSATQLNCSAFTVPSSTAWAVHRTKLLPSFWNATQSSQNQKYPWMFKIPKAVWRGSTTGHKSDWHDLPRARLVQTSIEHPSIVDAGFSKILQKPAVHKSQILRESRLVPSIEFKDFMMYRAVIDIDGNSWSSRFGELLCMNSVVIKVEPECIDHFYEDLKPWVHYIPVRSDLSDLVNVTTYAISDENQDEMKNIVLAANEWCKRSRTKAQMALDVLHVLIEYSEMLRRNDADWHTKWTNNRVASARGLSMVLVGKGGLLPDSEASALVHYAESQFRALQETQ